MEIRVFGHKIGALFGDIRSNIAALFFRDIGNTVEAVFDGAICLYIHQKRKTAIFGLARWYGSLRCTMNIQLMP